jgi:riboflavin synthase
MFTGIIEHVWSVSSISPESLTVRVGDDPGDWQMGESVAVNGCCLTVVEFGEQLRFDLSPETWNRTSFRDLKVGTRVNIERAMRAGDRFGGHIVQGHVDATGELTSRFSQDGYHIFKFQAPVEYDRYLIDKGSIAVEGISLTVVSPEAGAFETWIIPHTIENTNLGGLHLGDRVNLEFDVLAKHLEKLALSGALPLAKNA